MPKKLLPFSAAPIADPIYNEHVPNTYSDRCGMDQSGKVKYRYNDLGFRGENYNDDAKFHIYVCGPSEAFGTGLNEEDIWCYHFKRKFAECHHVSPELRRQNGIFY